MEFLKLLEGIRNPVLDTFFSSVTYLGDEIVFIVVGLVFFWCINKKEGYFILSIGFIGTILNQFLKLVFRVDRPWIKDPDFKPIESALEGAPGYSFPSGHSQISVGVFGSIFKIKKHTLVRIACILVTILVPLSRMYLGVHTPADVLVSAAISIALIFIIHPIINKANKSTMGMRIFFSAMLIMLIGHILFVFLYNFPADVDKHNLAHGVNSAMTMLGCILGFWVSYEIDNRFIKFETDGAWWIQVLKLVLGLIPLLAIKSLLKIPLNALISNEDISDAIRYFIIVLFAGCVWPLTFKYFKKLEKYKKQ